jgi:hypothetical protein
MKIFSCCFAPPSSRSESFSTGADPDSPGQHTRPSTRVRFTHDDGALPSSRRLSSATSSAREGSAGSALRFHSTSSASAHSDRADDVAPAESPLRGRSSASPSGIHSAAQAAERIKALDRRLNPSTPPQGSAARESARSETADEVTPAEPVSPPVFWKVQDEDQGSSSSSGIYEVWR